MDKSITNDLSCFPFTRRGLELSSPPQLPGVLGNLLLCHALLLLRKGITMAPRHPRSWDERLAEYKHNKENGLASSNSLRSWATNQRKAITAGTLSDECREKLDGVGFVWNAIPQGQFWVDHDAWNRMLELLKAHHLEQGNCDGPYHDTQLCKWVYQQRSRLEGKESLNDNQKERWARLNALGFWDAAEQQRESQRNDIRCGRELSSPVRQTTGGPQAISPTLLHPQKHIAMAPSRVTPWDDRFAEYKRNKEDGLANSYSMQQWAYKQLRLNANGTLSDERKEKLDSVGFAWNRLPCGVSYDCETWNENFKLLEAHHHEKRNSRGPFQDKQLEQWIRKQRYVLKDKESLNEIQQERWARLNSLGFWDGREQRRQYPGSAGHGSRATLRASRASANAKSDGDMGQGQQGGCTASTTVSHRLVLLERAPAARPNLPCFTCR
jgi:Helicase associated domain